MRASIIRTAALAVVSAVLPTVESAILPTVLADGPVILPTVLEAAPAILPTVLAAAPAIQSTVLAAAPAILPTVLAAAPAILPTVLVTAPAVDGVQAIADALNSSALHLNLQANSIAVTSTLMLHQHSTLPGLSATPLQHSGRQHLTSRRGCV
ncbi:uncharacterized protein K460DRAFT_179816 [Cucurbitaria berberidis CBS 394.84]|uniref:Uncharacterized protein n=1 Tax=Cucurbitaria berberidis CBS 394.84 TaxID=1168544 RepID=A0A9P4GAF3_9PLEO|nr:uncharacterized protein K460DRAFT_179816 [Cucurbitaria berberidis CBS 394.84]KAF1842163.1 hypothetical protein K460DRAFT_179816 [Cucurbitaria berberidis CBS 394.84]